MKILIVTDGSPQSEKVLRFASQIVKRGAETPTILTTIPRSIDTLVSQAEKVLKSAKDILEIPGAQTFTRIGDPCERIIQEARDGVFDLVILGDRRPKNLFARMKRSSNAIEVAEHAPCSVIIVRGEISNIHRILLCDSGSGMSSSLSRLTVQLADILEGEEDITVLHVMSQMSAGPGVPGGQLRAEAQELVDEHTPEGVILEQDLLNLEKPGIHPVPKVRHGLVVDEILAEAKSGDYDLVIVGAHPEWGLKSFLLDNIAHQILNQINQPIMVVKQKETTLTSKPE